MKKVTELVAELAAPAVEAAGAAEGYRVVDCSIQPTVTSAPYLDITAINGVVDGFDPEEKLLLVCNTGKRTYLAQNRLKFYGYKNTRVLEGGHMFSPSVLDK